MNEDKFKELMRVLDRQFGKLTDSERAIVYQAYCYLKKNTLKIVKEDVHERIISK